MTQREREPLASGQLGEDDEQLSLFGLHDDAADGADAHGPWSGGHPDDRRGRGDQRRRRARARRRGWLVVGLVVVVIALAAALGLPRLRSYFAVPDYSGQGSGTVSVTVQTGDTASDIGATLKAAGVVKSVTAFTDAASKNSAAQSLQPGVYRLHHHMSGSAALALMLDPASRVAAGTVLVPEGATTLDVAARLEKLYGAKAKGAIDKALRSPADLSVPTTYETGSRFPASVEGFLYPATYPFDASTSPDDALTTMVLRFVKQDRDTGFAGDAAKVGLSPYQALIVASIAQAEAVFPQDMPKVARTILNRLKAGRPLQFDSTSAYACKLAHRTSCIYSKVDSPYNTYLHSGLPPTPIGNPGADAMAAAVHPAQGDWLYFVNSDKAGHLFFTADQNAFARAAHTCAVNHWGCG